jgi:serine protease
MNHKRFPFIFWVACGLFISGAARANVLHVPADYPTIQAAINAASTADTVLVSPGTYFENLDFRGKAITVRSIAGPEVTIVDGHHAGAVVNFSSGEGPDSVIEGFTLQHGYSSWGSGISLFVTSPTITGNIIQYNDEDIGYWGAGIGGWSSSPIIEQNLFRYNTGDSQYLTGVISFVNGSSPLIANNILVSNYCRAITLILPSDTAPVVINNTIVGNPVGIDASIFGVGIFDNNILFDNDIGVAAGGGIVWENNLVFGGQSTYQGIADQTGINGNISADPLFADPSSADFHLLAGSPCIDAGFNGAPFLPATDFDGGPRIIPGQMNGPAIVDMGAYEFNPTNSVVSFPTITCPDAQTVECGTPATVTVTVGDADGDGLTVVWTVDGVAVQTNMVPAGTPPTMANVSFTAELPLGTNLVEITAIDSLTNAASCSTIVTVVDTTPPVLDSTSTSLNTLWPPNHNMVPVAINAVVVDNCGPTTWKIISVQSSEPVNGKGDGNTAPDWQITGDHTVLLRAERAGTGSGRVYTITIQAQDAAGNVSALKTVTVKVPKSQGKSK